MSLIQDKIQDLFRPYIGQSTADICDELLGDNYRGDSTGYSNSWRNKLSRTILERGLEFSRESGPTISLRFGNTEELYVLRSYVFEPNRVALKEDSPFLQIDYERILDEEWADTQLFKLLNTTPFLSVCYTHIKTNDLREKLRSEAGGDKLPFETQACILEKAVVWDFPSSTLESVKRVWQDTKNKILIGDFDNFITESQAIEAGIFIRNKRVKASDTIFVNGQEVPPKGFWISNKLIEKQRLLERQTKRMISMQKRSVFLKLKPGQEVYQRLPDDIPDSIARPGILNVEVTNEIVLLDILSGSKGDDDRPPAEVRNRLFEELVSCLADSCPSMKIDGVTYGSINGKSPGSSLEEFETKLPISHERIRHFFNEGDWFRFKIWITHEGEWEFDKLVQDLGFYFEVHEDYPGNRNHKSYKWPSKYSLDGSSSNLTTIDNLNFTRDILLEAIKLFDNNEPHGFGPSSTYDLIHNDFRYPPKAVVGLAAKIITGNEYGPHDFNGGLKTACFEILNRHGFLVEPKCILDVDALLAKLSHLPDDRRLENLGDRRGAFKRGWAKGEEVQYGDDVLERITWDNLGSRIGGSIGNKSNHIKDLVFGHLKDSLTLSRIASGEYPNQELLDDEDDEGDEEGRVRRRQHRYRERLSNLRQKRLDCMYELEGCYFCECCERRSPDSENPCSILEVHHIVPLSETVGVRRTTLDDLAVLCANCHRLIHAQMRKSVGHVSVENLKDEFYSELEL